jgi:hypothetical protein
MRIPFQCFSWADAHDTPAQLGTQADMTRQRVTQ